MDTDCKCTGEYCRAAAWGEVRYTSGATPTDYTFTGQYGKVDEFGLMYYNAR